MKQIDYKKVIRRYMEAGIRLWTEGEKLRFSAPKAEGTKDGLDEDKLAFLRLHKNEILQELKKEEKRFLLTDVQSAYLLGRLDSFDYGGVSCQIYLEMDYEKLEQKRCQWCWNELIKRHEMLRAIIRDDGYQTIEKKVPEFQVPFYSKLSQEELEKLRREMSENVFPIGEWPYFAIALSERENRIVMHVSFDFLIADWNSIWILLKEFEDLYYGRELKEATTLTFQRYLELENETISGPLGLKDKEYWGKRILNLPGRPMLSVKDKQEMEKGFDRLIFNLPPEEWNLFDNHAKKIGCTATAAVITAYALCLGTWSQAKNFCINLTLLNRLPISPEVYDVVGDFTSVNLLEVMIGKTESFSDKTKQIQVQMMEDLDHRLFSGVKTMREYAAVHGKEAALFPYVFTGSIGLVNAQSFTGRISGYGKSSTPQVFIDCQAMDGPDGLRINWDVRRGVFEPEVLTDLFETFGNLLHMLACQKESWNKERLVLTPQRQLDVRGKVNDTAKSFEKETLFEMTMKAMCEYPDRIAVIDKKEEITYGELKNRVLKIALSLEQNGCRQGDKIGVLLGKEVNQVAAVLGILAAKCAYVPLDKGQPRQRLMGIVKKANVKICICEENLEALFGEECRCCNVLSLLEREENLWNEKEFGGDLDDLAYVIFTSGSTGVPKGVQISNRAAFNTIHDINERFHVTKDDKVLSLSKLNFDLSVYDIFGLLSAGGTVVFPDEEKYLDASEWCRLLFTHGITIWNTVPAFMSMLMDYCEAAGESLPLRLVLLSGDWIPISLPEQIYQWAPESTVVSLGGATEASIWSNYYVCKKGEAYKNSIPYGYPLTNQRFFVADECGLPAPDYVPGELCICGEGLAEGYLDDDRQNAEHFVVNDYLKERVYRTGDYGYYRKDGAIIFLGRKDAQVKIRGHRIELGEIEKVLSEDERVEDVCAVVVERANRNKEILTIVTPALRGENVDAESLAESLSENEAQVKKPHDEEWENCRDNAALTAILFALQSLGTLHPGEGYALERVMEADGLQEKYRWLMKYYLLALEKAGWIERDGKEFKARKMIDARELEMVVKKMLEAGTGQPTVFQEYLANSFRKLREVWTGEENPVRLLYPQGSDCVLESLYANNNTAEIFNDQVAKAVELLARKKKGAYRILEIGGGSAATGRRVLKELSEQNLAFTYCFTDVAESFMARARQRMKEYENVSFQIFNVDEDYREQGFLPSSFDAVIATGVIENAKRIEDTLKMINELLVPGGFLFATEPTKEENWILAAQAVMMTPPEDELREEKLYLEEDAWRRVLKQTVSGALLEFPGRGKTIGNLKLWIKQMNVECLMPETDALIKRAKEYLPDYMIPGQIQIVSQLPLTVNGKVDRKQMQQWYVEQKEEEAAGGEEDRLHDDVEKEVTSIIASSLGLAHVRSDRNLYEYGVDSLVQAQIAGKLKSYVDETLVSGAVTFDQILRMTLNGTTAAELAGVIRKSCEEARRKPEKKEQSGREQLQEEPLGELTYLREGDGTMFVFLPPALGNLSGIADLSKAVVDKTSQAVVAITIKNARKYCQIDANKIIVEAADNYAQLLMDTGRQKFRLVGYCMGGFLALEISRRLTELGADVEKLIMIDSTPVLEAIDDKLIVEFIFLNSFYASPGKIFTEVSDKLLINAITYIFESDGGKIRKDSYQVLKGDLRYASAYALFERLKALTQEERFTIYAKGLAKEEALKDTLQMLQEQFAIYVHSFQASKLNTEAYFGDLLFLKAMEDQPYVFLDREAAIRFWKEICIGEVEVVSISGNHDTCIEGKNAQEIVSLLLE